MDIHYNAFISYRHHPEDIRVASQIHRLLEHYRVPRAIRQKTEGITRLFRDKEELPITSNLSDDITRALENSDFLIVICSTHTRESTWVLREIDTFLKFHDRSRILTVLVDGEPYDTIPEPLRYEDQTDPETGETHRVEYEPLSCDWRMPLRQAKREELPRLAAALLGCGYDELRQRERQYRTRRLVAGFSAALAATLCFAAYVMHNSMRIQQANDQLEAANSQLANANTQLENANTSLENANAEIRANYLRALQNQSEYLASAAEALLEDGDRMTAMLLALEALPEYEGERPYVAAAEYALGAAVGIYEAEESLVADGGFFCDAMVVNFRVSEDGGTIYILDSRNVLTVWDTNTYARRATVQLDQEPQEMLVTGEGNILLQDYWNGILACYDQEGQELWRLTADNLYGMAFLNGTETLMFVDSYLAESVQHYRLHFLDPATGRDAREPLMLDVPTIPYFLRETYSADSPVTMSINDTEGHSAVMVDLNTGELTQLARQKYSIRYCGLTADGNVLLLTQQERPAGDQGTYLEYLLTSPALMQVSCHDRVSGRSLWTAEFTSCIYSACCTLETIPGGEDILCQVGNVFVLLDGATGEIKAQSETASYVMWTQVREENTMAVLEDGCIGTFSHKDSSCAFRPYTKDDLICVDVKNAYYVADELNSQVTVYRSTSDENWNPFAENVSYPNEWHTNEQYAALEFYTSVQMYDAEQGILLWQQDIRRPEILGFSGDGATLWVSGASCELLIAIDVQTGEMTQTALPNEIEWISPYTGVEGLTSTDPQTYTECMSGNYVAYLTKEYFSKAIYLFRYDMETGTAEYWPLFTIDESYNGYHYGRVLAVTEEYALVWDITRGTVAEFCFATGGSRTVAEGIYCRPAVLLLESGGQYLLGAGAGIQLRSWSADAVREIRLNDIRAASFCVYGEYILTIGDDGSLYCFDAEGNQLAEATLHIYNSFSGNLADTNFDPALITWDFSADGSLVLGLLQMGNVIDCNTWQVRANIPYCYGYLSGQGRVLARSGSRLGTFPLYTLEEIKAMAGEALRGSTVTEEMRMTYGLD